MSTTIKRHFFVSIAMLVLLLVSTTAVMAEKTEKKAYFGTMMLTGIENPGTMTILKKGNTRLRDQVAIFYREATDSRITGYYKVVINVNVDSTWNGALWGTFHSCTANGDPVTDGWEGTYHGQYFYWPPNNAFYEFVAHGTGAYEGLQFKDTSAVAEDDLTPGSGDQTHYVGTIQGTSE